MESNQSCLSQINPSYKLIAHIIVMVMLMFIGNPIKTFVFWIAFLLVGLAIGGWTVKYLLKVMVSYCLFFVLVFWMLAAFGKGDNEIWQWAWFRITEESIGNGLTISLRMLAFVTIGLLFTSTTNLHLFMMSLIHQLKVSPKWAYGFLAGFRCIPMFQAELMQLKDAHRIRGYKQRRSWQSFKRYAIPLLTNAIRKSERMAIAMEARGFTGSRDRSYYKTTAITPIDVLYVGLLLLFAISMVFL